MDRHIELTQLGADLRKKIAEAQSLTKSADEATRQTGQDLLNELTSKHTEVMSELRTVVIRLGEQLSKEMEKRPKRDPPPLSTGTIERLELLFTPADRAKARETLLQFSDQRFCDRPAEAERVWFAALRASAGNLTRLAKAIETANGDYRDLLLEAGFASDPKGHLKWWPGQTTPAPPWAPKLPPPR